MVLIFILIFATMVVCSLVLFTKSFFLKTEINFYIKNQEHYNLVNTLKNLIEKKCKLLPCVNHVIDKNDFKNLKLIEAPVYVVDKNYLGENFLKLYKKVFENINFDINFIVLNGYIKINNPKINVVCLEKKYLTCQEFALLKSLNVNCKTEKFVDKEFEEINDFQTLHGEYDFDNLCLKATTEKGQKYLYKLPQSFYNYLILKDKNKIKIFDIFGLEILMIIGECVCNLINDNLLISASKSSQIIIVNRLTETAKYRLKLFNFDIINNPYYLQINKLKKLAKNEINKNIFQINQNINTINAKSINNYIKTAILRKNYLNDYLFLINNIFGINIKNNILIAKPNELINFDFSIKYKLDKEYFTINFSHIDNDKVKLNYVGHRLGHQENFSFGF